MESLPALSIVLVVAVATAGIVRGLDVRLVLLAAAGVIGCVAGDLRPVLRTFLETFSNEKYVVPLCAAMGFAYVLKHTGCDGQLVNLLVGPVRRVRFLMVPGVVLVGFVVNIPVVSQTSTAVCLGTVVVPLMRSAGFSPLAIGASLLLGASVGGELLNPSAVELLAVKAKTGTDLRELSWGYIPPLVFPVLVVSLLGLWWMSGRAATRADLFEATRSAVFPPLPVGERSVAEQPGEGSSPAAPTPEPAVADAPHPPRASHDSTSPQRGEVGGDRGPHPRPRNLVQAAVPLVPLLLLFLSGPPLNWLPIPADWVAIAAPDTPNPSRVTNSRLIGLAMLVGVLAAALAAPRKAAGCMTAFFDGAGYGFTNIVSLIVIAQCFGTALAQVGLAAELGHWIRGAPNTLEPLAAAVPCLFAAVCGSGIASSQSLYPFFYDPAVAVGVNPDEIGALVSVGSAVGRTLSPVSAVALMCGTLAGVKATDLSKRLAVPLLLGLTATVVLHVGGAGQLLREAYRILTQPTGPVTLTEDQLAWMPLYYLITVAVELPVLWVALSRRHSPRVKLFAGFWLTACTYPVLWLVLPPLFDNYRLYLLVGETLVPIIECLLFWLVFIRGQPSNRRATLRDLAAIAAANLASFGVGLVLNEVW